jgi:DEAD/DEAH box helicase domain-containing protein
MDVQSFIQRLTTQRYFSNQIVHVEALPERPAVFEDLRDAERLHPYVAKTLEKQGISRLYAHQAEAVRLARARKNVVIVTGTASGKTLCYNIPVIETLLADCMATMLYLFPTKALAQDQMRQIGNFLPPQGNRKSVKSKKGVKSVKGEQAGRAHGDAGDMFPSAEAGQNNATQASDDGADFSFLAGAYDGDTPANLRRKLRDGGNIVLTNPDMLHQGILPQHARWNRFFTHLSVIVIDEVHAYRGVFGSHLANVMRRLDRICRHYGSAPVFICCSATIDNPREHAQRITGRPMELVNRDGSPRGPKKFVFWNPPLIETAATGPEDDWRVGGDRRSPLWEAVQLMTQLVKEEIQTIAFVRTRLAAELIFKNARDYLRGVSKRLAESVHAYRGGYLPEERREIERKLASRELLGVASTNALELGIDIGSLDACILVGYPGTIASLWQQAGRAGRGTEESVVFLVGQNAPMDQYLMLNCDYIFGRSPEQAIVDPDNPHIAVGHIKCAVHEMALRDDEVGVFGPFAQVVLDLLEDEGSVRHTGGCWYWAKSEYPATETNLRNISGPVYTIQDESAGEEVIGTMDEVSALAQLHDHAVYLHGADTYFVNQLDLDQKIARVERRDLDYYTQSVQVSQIRIDEIEEEREWVPGVEEMRRVGADDAGSPEGARLGFGDVTVTTSIPMFKKIKFHSRDSLGYENLELPPQTLETVAMWLCPSEQLVEEMRNRGMVVGEALIGVANVLAEVARLFVMCDSQDIGTVVDSACLKRETLFLHDRHPGGVGYARRSLDRIEEILRTCLTVVRECACVDGCPSCVGSAIPPFAMTDLDSAVRGRIPNKAGALLLLERVLGPIQESR